MTRVTRVKYSPGFGRCCTVWLVGISPANNSRMTRQLALTLLGRLPLDQQRLTIYNTLEDNCSDRYWVEEISNYVTYLQCSVTFISPFRCSPLSSFQIERNAARFLEWIVLFHVFLNNTLCANKFNVSDL